MKRILAWICIALTLAAFLAMCLVLKLKIPILIPICMFAAAFVLLAIVKRLPNDATGNKKTVVNDTAFYDDSGK